MSSKNKTFSEEEQRTREVSRQKKEEETKRKIEEYHRWTPRAPIKDTIILEYL